MPSIAELIANLHWGTGTNRQGVKFHRVAIDNLSLRVAVAPDECGRWAWWVLARDYPPRDGVVYASGDAATLEDAKTAAADWAKVDLIARSALLGELSRDD